jgi:hypothetical protein
MHFPFARYCNHVAFLTLEFCIKTSGSLKEFEGLRAHHGLFDVGGSTFELEATRYRHKS